MKNYLNRSITQNKRSYAKVYIKDDSPFFPMATKTTTHGGIVNRSRLVMAKHLGRPLTSEEVVHHKDGNCRHDEVNNLVILNSLTHSITEDIVALEKYIVSSRAGIVSAEAKVTSLKSRLSKLSIIY